MFPLTHNLTAVFKRLLLSVASLLIAGSLFAQKVDPNFHLYLLAGQSNMAGRGPVDSVSKQTDPQILMLDKNNKWVPATDPVHFDKPGIAGVGPAIAFAKEMIKGNKTIRIGLIPCAEGGSPIKVWEPDSTFIAWQTLVVHPYNDAVERTKIAMQSGILKGILWHQGESDDNPKAVKVYMDKLSILINRFRSAFDNPQLPFVAGELGHFYHDDKSPINAILNSLPRTVPYTQTVSSQGLVDKGDKTHFDTPSARELGRRYAVDMKKLQSSENKK